MGNCQKNKLFKAHSKYDYRECHPNSRKQSSVVQSLE